MRRGLLGGSIDFAGAPDAPAGQSYAIWLIDDAGAYRLAGAAASDAIFSYMDAADANLVGTTAGVAVSAGEEDIVTVRFGKPTSVVMGLLQNEK